MNRILFLTLISCSGIHLVAQELPSDHVEVVKHGTKLFKESVRQTLVERCLKCHGGEKVRSGFDLSTRERLLAGGDSGAVVDLKDPASSYLLGLISHADEPTMPPASEKLNQEQIEAIGEWLSSGAPYDKPLVERNLVSDAAMRVTDEDRKFWSFRPLSKVRPPETDSSWPQGEIDQFVLSKLNVHGLVPNSAASDFTRIRRAYLDVIGLPPTKEQLQSALAKTHAELIDELLESPHYGERWARHWLDAARFAESHGFEQDYDRKFAYHFRDFVIKALNDDMPWDQFVRWQIAGDELAPEEPLAMMATGFLGAGVFPTQLTEKEFESARYDELDDMAATVGTAMLGLTIGCARCHDHKFDPIPVKDYYRFVSTFTTTIRSEVDVNLDPEGYESELDSWRTAHREKVQLLREYEASTEFIQCFDKWLLTHELEELLDDDWRVLGVEEANSTGKQTKLIEQEDGSILAKGNASNQEVYTCIGPLSTKDIRFLRIEALTDLALKKKGPGRAGNGNVALSDLKVNAIRGDGQKQEFELVSARATHEQNSGNLSVAAAIDEDANGTGWAVDFGGIGKDQAAVFEFRTPIAAKDFSKVEVVLAFKNNSQHSLGRFRLSVSDSSDPPVEVGATVSKDMAAAIENLTLARKAVATRREPVKKANVKKADEPLVGLELPAKTREVLLPLFGASDDNWHELSEQVESSLKNRPTPPITKVQVSSEGFPPTKHHADGRGFPHFYPQTFFLTRGDPSQKGEVAPAGFLQVLMRNGKSDKHWQVTPPSDWNRTSFRRAALANWITDTQNGAGHLLARVAVNRLWQHHFGTGLVATPNDFGLQGKLPTHPELLDFLAQKLIDNNWQLKAIHREILLSATWLQSSERSPTKSELDPTNRWLSRYPSRRLEAEVIRDAMLASSGQLHLNMYGPGTLDASHRRRSIYFMIKRSKLVPMMQIFDQPEPLSSQGSRPSTTIAPQALLFMNNSQVVDWASALAEAVEPLSTEEAVDDIYLRTLSRHPSLVERRQSREFIVRQAESYSGAEARKKALADFCQVIFGLNEFIYLP